MIIRCWGQKPPTLMPADCSVLRTMEDLKKNGFYQHCDEILQEKTKGLGIKVTREDIIHSFDNAKGTDGSIAKMCIRDRQQRD